MRIKPSYPRLRQGHPLSNGLVWLFPFADRGGKPTEIRNQTAVTEAGTNEWVAGSLGPEFKLLGESSNLGLPESPFDTARRSVFVTLTPASLRQQFPFASGSGNPNRFYMELTSGGGYQTRVGTAATVVSSVGYSAGERISLALTYDGAFARAYVDGQRTSSQANNTLSGVVSPTIGAFANKTLNCLDAAFEFFASYDRALGDDDIAELFADPFAMLRPRQRSYFAFFAGGAVGGALSGTATGTSALSGDLNGTASLSGSSTGQSIATGSLTAKATLSGTAAGQSSLSADLTGGASLSAVAPGQSELTGVLTAIGLLSGTSTGESTLNGNLSVDSDGLSGTVAATSSLSGTLSGKAVLAGQSIGESALSGNLTISSFGELSGAIAATSELTAILRGRAAMSGTATGQSTLSGTLVPPATGGSFIFGNSSGSIILELLE